jgi:hypothetical protein
MVLLQERARKVRIYLYEIKRGVALRMSTAIEEG